MTYIGNEINFNLSGMFDTLIQCIVATVGVMFTFCGI